MYFILTKLSFDMSVSLFLFLLDTLTGLEVLKCIHILINLFYVYTLLEVNRDIIVIKIIIIKINK